MPPLDAAKASAAENLRPTVSPKLPLELQKLIAACWHPDPLKRPTASEVSIQLEAMFPQIDPDMAKLMEEPPPGCCALQ